jgi:dihydroorotase
MLVFDLLLRGGHVMDPKNGVDAPMDVAIQAGRVARVAARIDPAEARQVIDVTGLYVTPGLVDIHVHVFHTTGVRDAWAGDNSVQPDAFSFRTGVTTMCDAGSSGWRNFEDFRRTVIDRVKTRVLAFLNIAGLGMTLDQAEQGDFDPEAVARVARRNKDYIVGVKSAHYRKPDWASVDAAVRAGTLAGLPVMVDFGNFRPERPYWQLVGEHLRPGDISTHMFRGPVPWVDAQGKLYDYLRRARERGVLFDVGHGGASFVFRNAVPAIRQDFYPDTISSDLHNASMNAGMQDMPATMSKFLAMGMPLSEVVLRSTWKPAQVIHRPDLGHLGGVADVAVFALERGSFGFADGSGGRLDGDQRLVCELTLKDGQVVWDRNARAATDYHKLPPDYGVRPGADEIVPPR